MGFMRNVANLFSIGNATPSDYINSQVSESMEDLLKSERARESKSIIEDPLSLVTSMGFKDKPSSVTYDTLNRMATRNSVVASIIATRVNQVSTFTKPARYTKDGVGFEINMRNPNVKPTAEQKQLILSLETFIENCGYNYDPGRDDFDTLVRKIVRDSLIYDQMCFEIVPDRLGRPAEICAVDASTIRAAVVEPNDDSKFIHATTNSSSMNNIKWVQIINGEPIAEFTGKELAFAVRNPRTDVNLQPYGFSELEVLIHQITAHLWAEEYNSKYFSQGGTTKGILNLKGQNINKEQLEAFRRQWTAQIAGVTGSWKTPVVSVDGLEYINVSQSNREMEYEMWMNYLINIVSSVYQIDPAEINFPNRGGSAGRGGGLGEGGIEDRLKNSRDKGLRPLLRFIETTINRYIVRQFSNELTFNFVGLDPETEGSREERQNKQVRTYKTVNEIRKEHDQEPIEGGDIILDPTYTNYLLQVKQQEQMEQMEQQQGMPGGEGEPQGEEGQGDPNQAPQDMAVSYPGQEDMPEQNSMDAQKQQEDDTLLQSMDEKY